MASAYSINNYIINSIEELADYITEDFSLVFDYFQDEKKYTERFKKLVSFVKTFDKPLSNKINTIISETKYLHNTLTFIVFELTKGRRVIINGKDYSFNDFVLALKNNGRDNKALMTFIEDNGISRTYGKIIDEVNFETNMYIIEKNINNDFVFNYLITYFEYAPESYIKGVVGNLIVNPEEAFLRADQAFREEKFLTALGHKVKDLQIVLDIIQTPITVFKIVKLLYDDFNGNDLIKICSNAFYDWMLEYFNFYKYKGKAKKVKASYNKMFTLYKKKMKNFDELDKNSFNEIIDLLDEICKLYLDFARMYQEKKIIAKKEEFELKEKYLSTLICQKYIETNIVNLKHVEILDSQVTGLKISMEQLIEKKPFKKKVKRYNKLGRFSTKVSVLSLVFIILVIAIVGIYVLSNGGVNTENQPLKFIVDIVSDINIEFVRFDYFHFTLNGTVEIPDTVIILVGLFVVTFILGIVLKCKANKSKKNYLNYVLLNNLKQSTKKLNKRFEKTLSKLEKKEDKLNKKINKTHKLFACIVMFFYTLSLSLLVMIILYILRGTLASMNFGEPFNRLVITNEVVLPLSLVFGPLLALIYGLIKKNKGFFTTIILLIFAIAGVALGLICFSNGVM